MIMEANDVTVEDFIIVRAVNTETITETSAFLSIFKV